MSRLSILFLLLASLRASLAQPAACRLRPDAGPCEAAIPRWYYDASARACARFLWGGCAGVVPFASLAACQSARCDACTEIPETGPCRARFIRWFFDNARDKCTKFIWGGCKGNVPFTTRAQCRAAGCVPVVPPSPTPLPPAVRCKLEPRRGPCTRSIKRWFFDQRTGKCASFSWSGCFGTVPFGKKKDCRKAKCMVDRCKLAPQVGPCKARIPRYFFDAVTKKCKLFFWGGCKGVVPFKTLSACKDKCDPCDMAPDVGPCDGSIEKWFYNAVKKKCEPFFWGGCAGTVPFQNRKDCVGAKCGKELVVTGK